jgi:hypothetical protein
VLGIDADELRALALLGERPDGAAEIGLRSSAATAAAAVTSAPAKATTLGSGRKAPRISTTSKE